MNDAAKILKALALLGDIFSRPDDYLRREMVSDLYALAAEAERGDTP